MPEDRPRVMMASTGNDSELIETLPITVPASRERRVAMSLGPTGKPESSMPDLAPGDSLVVTAEVELTTDPTREQATEGAPHKGEPYDYAPTIEARLLLAAEDGATEEGARALRIGQAQRLRLTHAEHHGLIVFTESRLELPADLPSWLARSRHVNLVLEAFSGEATGKEVLLVGENEEDGSVGQDKGRIGVIRLRGGAAAAKTERTSRPRIRRLPVLKNDPHVVYSCQLDNLRAGEQLSVHALLIASAGQLPEPARISTHPILADGPDATGSQGRAREVASFGGEVGEHNGFNLIPGHGPIPTRRAGVLRIERDAGRPLYLNLVADTGSPMKNLSADDSVEVAAGGYLEVSRFGPEMKG
jgi:hypothetical protein